MMCRAGGKFLSEIKSVYVDSLDRVRVKGSESEWFRIYSGVRRECIMFPWLFIVCMDGVMKEGRDSWRMGESGPPSSSSIKTPATLRTLSTKIPPYIFPTTLNKLIPL